TLHELGGPYDWYNRPQERIMSYCVAILLLFQGDHKVAPIKSRAVDYISVRNQLPFFGVVVEHQGTQPTVVAVQRKWLKAERPEQYEAYRKQEIQLGLAQRKALLARINKWIKERSQDADLVEYLNEQKQVLTQLHRVPDEPKTQFMLITLPSKSVRRVQRSAGKPPRPLWPAHREKLQQIETRSAESLEEELRKNKVAVPTSPVDLSNRIPSPGDNEIQWAARQAIIEQLYRSPVKMVGTPNMLVRENGNGNRADAGQIIAKLMQSQVSDLIKELSEPNAFGKKSVKPAWMKQAIAEAKKTDSRAAYVMLVTPDPTMREAVVEAYLIGRMPNGSWRTVWNTRHTAKPSEDKELEDQIREDDQVKSILNTLGALGHQDAIDKAIRFGAATMKAQRAARDAYVYWRDPFFDRLDQPMLKLPK
ncbi:MAG: hypothetical protein AB8G99_25990, partial [Planctomycetaceae bacterium]